MASQQQSNVDLVREAYEAFNERDFKAVMELFDEDIKWVVPEGLRYGRTYHGPEEVGGFFERVLSDIEDLDVDTDRFINGGETVVVLGSARGTATKTGDTLDIPFAHVCDLTDGKITGFQEYNDTARMEQALGT